MSIQLVPFSELPPEEKPREKIIHYGVNFLDDTELLAVFLGTGYKGRNVKELSKHLLAELGTKGLLQFSSLQEIQEKTGLPFVKSCQILALSEYFRRVYRKDQNKILSSEQLYEYIQNTFKASSFECLYIVCLDAQRRVLHSSVVAQGESNCVQVSLSSIFHHPIRLNSKYFYLAHNHPHGDSKASPEDVSFTLQIKEEAQKFGLSFDDHIILGEDGFYSFSLQGIL